MQQDDWNAILATTFEMSPGQRYRNSLVLQEITRMAQRANLGETFVLADFGCGRGDLLVLLREAFPKATLLGLEYTESGRKGALQAVPTAIVLPLDLERAELTNAEWREKVDVGVCSEVLEHLDHPELGIKQLKEYLKPGAQLLVTVPGGPMHGYDKFIGHRQHFNRNSLRKLLGPVFHIEGILRHGFPFFSGYKLLGFLHRTESLHDDLHKPAAKKSRLMRWLLSVFDRLLRHNRPDSWLGWQMVARCQKGAGK